MRETTLVGYTIRCYRVGPSDPSDHGTVGIFRDTRLTYWKGERWADVTCPVRGDNASIFADLNGDGTPNLVLETGSTDCLDCPGGTDILDLGPTFRNLYSGRMVNVRDVTGDGVAELMMEDDMFSGNEETGGENGVLVLRYANGSYQISPDLMRKPAPDSATLAARADSLRSTTDWKETGSEGLPHAALVRAMIDLAYGGHVDLALRLVGRAWPPGTPGKDDFVSGFRRMLAESRYGQAIHYRAQP